MIVKFVIVPCSTVIGLIYGFDMYVVGRASTVVQPVKERVSIIGDHMKEHQERVERELIMIRNSQDETNKYLRTR
jgi:hypothetical protein